MLFELLLYPHLWYIIDYMKIYRELEEKYGSFFEDDIWLKWADEWFKLIEWVTFIGFFEYLALVTGNKVLNIVVLTSYNLVWYYLYNKLFNTCWFEYKFTRWISLIVSLSITTFVYIFISKIVEQIVINQ